MFEARDQQTQKERGKAKTNGVPEPEAFDESAGT